MTPIRLSLEHFAKIEDSRERDMLIFEALSELKQCQHDEKEFLESLKDCTDILITGQLKLPDLASRIEAHEKILGGLRNTIIKYSAGTSFVICSLLLIVHDPTTVIKDIFNFIARLVIPGY